MQFELCAASLGEVVIFTCSVPDSATLTWTLMPYPGALTLSYVVQLIWENHQLKSEMNITATLTVLCHPIAMCLVQTLASSILTIVQCSGGIYSWFVIYKFLDTKMCHHMGTYMYTIQISL